jgi:serine O-acetyltransferase
MQQSSLHNKNQNQDKQCKQSSDKHSLTPRVYRVSKTFCQNLFSGAFFESIFEPVRSDFRIIFERDPAARNWLEVMFCYPGLHALCFHRIAHWLYRRQLAFIPRLISHLGRFLTGIEIHPGAQIGQGVFIDHGMGVVIGETAIVGDNTLIYQGVTLGGTGKQTGKRHPTIGKNVVVGAGAKVLGNIEVGDRVRIGAHSVVLRDVPPDNTVVGVPGRNIPHNPQCSLLPLEHGKLPDVEGDMIRSLLSRIQNLEQQVETFTNCASKKSNN